MLTDIFIKHLDVVFFFYGSAFGVLGTIIFLQLRVTKKSEFRLLSILWLLALFGITHAVNEFIDMFIIIKGELAFLKILGAAFLFISYLFLLLFGYQLINTSRRKRFSIWFPVIIIILFFGLQTFLGANNLWKISARYLLGFPGAILSVAGFLLYYKSESEKLSRMKVKKHFIYAALFFGIYGVLGGLIVPRANFFPASAVNEASFTALFGAPVQVFRAVSAGGITFSIWNIMNIFNIEETTERTGAEEALRKAHDELEIRVQERTEELAKANEKLKQTLKELERSNKELEQFAYVASHDLQEPMRMVMSFTQLLEKRYKDKLDKDADEFITYIVNGAKKMQEMINDLLAYSRVGTRGKPFELTDCEAVLDTALAYLKVTIEENNAIITHDPLPVVMADDLQMIQLFQNLLSNAIKFRKKGEHPKVHVSAEKKGNEWIFSVHDNGIGIAPEFYESVFMMFQRLHREYPGTGMGLAICKRIVERHGGRIWIESEPGNGSKFYFTIPAGE